jgi:hypothetical protein
MSVGAALLRFWWIAVAGVAAGAAAGLGLLSRQPAPVYTANATVLVTSASEPYLRTAQPQPAAATAAQPAASKGKKAAAKKSAPQSRTTVSTPNTQVLVNAANLYPLLIESGQIKRLRESVYGKTPGTLTATAFASATNTYGVYHPSPLPVIVVKATSQHADSASRLAVFTVRAFRSWIAQQQQRARIPASQRIGIEQLRVRVTSASSSSRALPIFVGGVILLAFCGVAVLADRLRPRRERVPAASHQPV